MEKCYRKFLKKFHLRFLLWIILNLSKNSIADCFFEFPLVFFQKLSLRVSQESYQMFLYEFYLKICRDFHSRFHRKFNPGLSRSSTYNSSKISLSDFCRICILDVIRISIYIFSALPS